MNNEQGVKYDENKLRMDLVTPEMFESLAEVLTFGAEKYGDENWKKGIDFSRNIAAAYRHINDWRKGLTFDLETGYNHLAHAAINLLMIVHQQKVGRVDLDDRIHKANLAPLSYDPLNEREHYAKKILENS